MDAQEEMIECEVSLVFHDDLAIEHESPSAQGKQGFHQLGEVAFQRLARLGLQADLVAIPERDAAEAIPLGFVLRFPAPRQLVSGLGLHRRVGKAKRELHASAPRSKRPREARSGFQRSPSRASRARMFRMVKSAILNPRSTSAHVTGVDTVASSVGRSE